MARFRYSMQSILDIKMKMETQAKQEFGSARAALDEEEARLQELLDRKRGYEQEAAGLLKGMLNLRAIEDNKTAILCMDDYISGQRLRVTAAERNLEQARKRLTEVMMERKTHESLRDKAFQQFLMDEKKQESKEIDELTSYTYGQRKKDDRSRVLV